MIAVDGQYTVVTIEEGEKSWPFPKELWIFRIFGQDNPQAGARLSFLLPVEMLNPKNPAWVGADCNNPYTFATREFGWHKIGYSAALALTSVHCEARGLPSPSIYEDDPRKGVRVAFLVQDPERASCLLVDREHPDESRGFEASLLVGPEGHRDSPPYSLARALHETLIPPKAVNVMMKSSRPHALYRLHGEEALDVYIIEPPPDVYALLETLWLSDVMVPTLATRIYSRKVLASLVERKEGVGGLSLYDAHRTILGDILKR